MKKKSVYWLEKLGILAALSMLFMAASAVLRIVWAAGEELPAPVFWFQVVHAVQLLKLFIDLFCLQ